MQGDGGGISSQASQPQPVADPRSHTPVSTPAYPRRGLPATYKSDGRPPTLTRTGSSTAGPCPQRNGCTQLTLTPLEFIDHLAALIPPPRLHRHRYHGVLAPNSPLRGAATAYGRDADLSGEQPPPLGAAHPSASPPGLRASAHSLWAMLLARLFESLPLVCPHCGAEMRIVACITQAAPVQRILNHIGAPAEPPRISPARGPPAWDDPPIEAVPDWDALAQPPPEYVFDQQVQW